MSQDCEQVAVQNADNVANTAKTVSADSSHDSKRPFVPLSLASSPRDGFNAMPEVPMSILNSNDVLSGMRGKAESFYVYEDHGQNLSIASRSQRNVQRSNRWIFIIALLMSAIFPYWFGRTLAVSHTSEIVNFMSNWDVRGIALVSWLVMLGVLSSVGAMLAWPKKKISYIVFMLLFCVEQCLSGFALLNFNFWYATNVLYQENAVYINAVDWGILVGALGFAVFAVLYVALLIIVKKTSKLNVLTDAFIGFTMFYAVELIAVCIILFGGVLNLGI